ncbi:MAG: gamma-glutamyltransferase [Verrucomicrobiales bacterium]|nr:gamma-glutamyltransferase [Verrucomicrobiales bacterium]
MSMLTCVVPGSGADRVQGRSMVLSRQGIVAAEHPLAAQAGAHVLAEGGTAVDAAIAANAVMGVVAPMTCGMGGDLFALVYDAASGTLQGLNSSGWAPAGLTRDFLTAKGFGDMPQRGIHSVTIPGCVAGWEALQRRFGRKSLRELLGPAIRLAADGFPVSEIVAGYWASGAGLMSGDPVAARTFLPGGKAPSRGEIFRNPDLAWSLRWVAEEGCRAFYEGAVAERLLACSAAQGGVWTAEDLSLFRPEWVTPISTTYRGWTVYEIPPQGQGIAALLMLNLMEPFPLADWGFGSVDALHTMIEAKKLAYADLRRYVGDLRFGPVPVAGMLAKDYARERARLIDPERAGAEAAPGEPALRGGTDTTYLCAVDARGNMVSFIQSNYAGFGSGLVAEGTGFGLQNRGGLFTLEAGHPNALAGRKRPLHTIIPGFMEKDGVRIAFGIMGGWNQAQAHAQFVANLVDFDLNLQASLEAPRFTKMSFDGTDVELEARFPAEVREGLKSRGHEVRTGPSFSQNVGGGQAVMRDFAKGINYGASDPRKDGAAIPEPVRLD